MPAVKKLDDFKKLHDKSFIVPKLIQDGINKLGAKGWEYELEFSKLAGITSLQDLAKYREQFSDFYVDVRVKNNLRRAWCGSKALATQLRAML